jgi:hypothetical protein
MCTSSSALSAASTHENTGTWTSPYIQFKLASTDQDIYPFYKLKIRRICWCKGCVFRLNSQRIPMFFVEVKTALPITLLSARAETGDQMRESLPVPVIRPEPAWASRD